MRLKHGVALVLIMHNAQIHNISSTEQMEGYIGVYFKDRKIAPKEKLCIKHIHIRKCVTPYTIRYDVHQQRNITIVMT